MVNMISKNSASNIVIFLASCTTCAQSCNTVALQLTSCGGAALPILTETLNAVTGCIDQTVSCPSGTVGTEYFYYNSTMINTDTLTCTNGIYVSAANGGRQVYGFSCGIPTSVETCNGSCATGWTYNSATGFCYLVCYNDFVNKEIMFSLVKSKCYIRKKKKLFLSDKSTT
jgi:hypothetical protein